MLNQWLDFFSPEVHWIKDLYKGHVKKLGASFLLCRLLVFFNIRSYKG